jgi:hypothetical protein
MPSSIAATRHRSTSGARHWHSILLSGAVGRSCSLELTPMTSGNRSFLVTPPHEIRHPKDLNTTRGVEAGKQ